MKSLILSLLIFALSPLASAASVYVAPIKGTGVAKNELEALRELIIANVQSGDHSVVDGQSQAEVVLQSKLIKFATYTLTMTKWQGNQKVNSGQWKASNSAELENATQKAVSKMMGGKLGMKGNTTTLGEQVAIKQKNQTTERVAAHRQVLLGFGPSYFDNMNNPDSGLALLLGYYWNINDNVDLGLQTDFAFSTEDSDTTMGTAKIMANYFPVLFGDTSPYLGAGFGYGFATAHNKGLGTVTDRKSAGFAGSLQAGLKFFRTSSVNLGVGFDYTVIFNKTDYGNPSRLIFKVGLYY